MAMTPAFKRRLAQVWYEEYVFNKREKGDGKKWSELSDHDHRTWDDEAVRIEAVLSRNGLKVIDLDEYGGFILERTQVDPWNPVRTRVETNATTAREEPWTTSTSNQVRRK
jgi:hypothetical protein